MALKVHHLRPAPGAKTAKTRVGRGEGGKGGKTAGRGTKGTGARKGTPANFEGGQMPLQMRLPKLRGFKNPFRVEFQVVNLDKLGSLFPQGGSVGVDDLVAAGAVRREPAGQGPRQRRDRRRGAGERARVLRQRQGQDRCRRREHHRALSGPDGPSWARRSQHVTGRPPAPRGRPSVVPGVSATSQAPGLPPGGPPDVDCVNQHVRRSPETAMDPTSRTTARARTRLSTGLRRAVVAVATLGLGAGLDARRRGSRVRRAAARPRPARALEHRPADRVPARGHRRRRPVASTPARAPRATSTSPTCARARAGSCRRVRARRRSGSRSTGAGSGSPAARAATPGSSTRERVGSGPASSSPTPRPARPSSTTRCSRAATCGSPTRCRPSSTAWTVRTPRAG